MEKLAHFGGSILIQQLFVEPLLITMGFAFMLTLFSGELAVLAKTLES